MRCSDVSHIWDPGRAPWLYFYGSEQCGTAKPAQQNKPHPCCSNCSYTTWSKCNTAHKPVPFKKHIAPLIAQVLASPPPFDRAFTADMLPIVSYLSLSVLRVTMHAVCQRVSVSRKCRVTCTRRLLSTRMRSCCWSYCSHVRASYSLLNSDECQAITDLLS